ncbi:MAG TPA: glutathione S-transferase family protein [Acetobacteraceae bacterium]|jgi:glutathione S-transferase|nr:glutathione S-transferase family protein [Acetobacteraceae bacterium]
MLRLYDYLPSQNGWKVRMLLGLLGLRYEPVPVAIFRGESRLAQFLEKNPAGAVPVLEVAAGQYIAESGAILCYLAEGSRFLPDERLARAKSLQWLFFEQYFVEPNIGTLRFWTLTGRLAANEALVPAKRAAGERALDALERHLERHPLLANDSFSIADIAVFAYTHLAEEGGFELSRRPALRAWLGRVAEMAGGVPEVHAYTIDPDAVLAEPTAAGGADGAL